MLVPDIGKEVAAVGLGLDAVGAIYFGLSLLRSPMYASSLIWADDIHPGFRGQVSTLPIAETVESMLQARVGMAFLLSGFLLQLIGGLLPGASAHWGLPLLLAIAAMAAARHFGNRWIAARRPILDEAIWKSGQITSLVELNAMRMRPKSYPDWVEPAWIREIRLLFQPDSYRRPGPPFSLRQRLYLFLRRPR